LFENMYHDRMNREPLRELLQARLTAARLEQIAISREIQALEEQLDTLAAMWGAPPSAKWDISAAPTHNVAVMSVLLNTEDPMSPVDIGRAIVDAGRKPPSQIGFYINHLYRKGAIRRVAYGKYRPGALTAITKPYFPEGYTGDGV
jgi:hypothetical protein